MYHQQISESGLYPFTQAIDEDVKQDQAQLGNITTYRLPTRLCADDHNPLSSSSQLFLSVPHFLSFTTGMFSETGRDTLLSLCSLHVGAFCFLVLKMHVYRKDWEYLELVTSLQIFLE